MAIRYQQQKRVDAFLEKIWKILIASFDSCAQLETFVSERLGNEVVNGINWDQALKDAAFDLLTMSLREGFFDKLIGALREEQPDNIELSGVVSGMVNGGFLTIVAE